MAKADDSALTELMKQTQAAVTLNPMLRPQIDQYWQMQEKMLREAEAFTKHWFERRHTATETALKASKDAMSGGSDPTDALKTMSDWQQHSMERLVEDFREWVELCSRCAGHVTRAEVEAEVDGLKRTAKQVAASTNTKHSTPV
ncbi:Phasin protein [Jannaschia faecimaris]|uniref:Phasin protein n=1 Tax=Jannaschia faecimaris TaxID=1244108 RepID=A0A1H3UEE7_9RHOB|nr:phasin family protein [Jannaschia faecimaris]SDZ60029.1 Phasin protein [Jannaschia faecimaris]